MTLVHVKPGRRRQRHLWNDFDRMFESLTNDSVDETTRYEGAWSPSMDLIERKDGFELTAEIPGISEGDIDISFQENVLTISGKKGNPQSKDVLQPRYSERSFGEFKRSIRFNTAVEQKDISAEYQNGVLTIFLPKTKKAMEKEIPVNFTN